MSIPRRISFAVSVSVALSAALVALTAPVLAAQTRITVVTRGGGYHRSWWLATLDAFGKANPSLKVNEVFVGDGSNVDKIVAMVAAGIAPDVVQMDYALPFAAAGMLEPLDGYMKTARMSRADFGDTVLKPFIYEGKVYGFDSNPRVQTGTHAVNVDMFNRAGVPIPDGTWRWEEEGLANGRKLTIDANGDGNPEQFFYHGVDPGDYMKMNWIYAGGGSFMAIRGGKPTFTMTEKGAYEGLQFFIDLSRKYHIAPRTTLADSKALGGEHPWVVFWARPGRVAMVEGPRTLGTTYKTKFTFAQVPLLTYNSRRASLSYIGTGWGMMKSAKNKRDAWTFIKWTQSREAQRIVCDMGAPGVPSVKDKSVWDYYYNLQDTADAKVFRDVLASNLAPTYYAAPPETPNWLEIAPVYLNAVNKAAAGKVTLRDAMISIESQVNKMLQRTRPLLMKK